jgi:hypothetical protein
LHIILGAFQYATWAFIVCAFSKVLCIQNEIAGF